MIVEVHATQFKDTKCSVNETSDVYTSLMKLLRLLLQSVHLHTVLHINIVQLILRLHIIHACVLYVHVHKTLKIVHITHKMYIIL